MNQNAFDLEAEMPHGLELYFQMQRTYPSTAFLKQVCLHFSLLISLFTFIMPFLPLVEDTEVIENVDEAGLYTMASLVLGMTDGGDLI